MKVLVIEDEKKIASFVRKGLGLSLAREIVRAHGGELVLKESRVGRSCFELRLNRRA